MSEQHDQFLKTFLIATLALFLLGAIAIGLPTLAWHRMTKEKQRAEQRTRQYAHRLKLALKAADAIVFEYDYTTKQYWASDEMVAILGAERVRSATALPLDLFTQDHHGELRAFSLRMSQREELGGLDAKLLTLDGIRWIRLFVEVERQEDGQPLRAVGLMLNIDEKKKQELVLDEAHKAARAAATAKSNFLAAMSHEIRTPLNGVLGMAQALRGRRPDRDQSEKVGIILDCGSTLMALLNDVLDLSKIEAGKMDIAPIDGDLRDMHPRARATVQSRAQRRKASR